MNNASWWANKLQQQSNNPPTRRDAPNLTPPSQVPLAQMPSFQTNPNAAERAQSAKQTATCPECSSGNYMTVSNAAPRCYDCGYPISQSGSRYGSLTGAHVEGSAKGARGNDPASNWNPQGIIGRIDG
jgi:hypothetical protein